MKTATILAVCVVCACVSVALAKKEAKKPMPEYIKKMIAENKGKREAALPYSYAAPHHGGSVGGAFNIGSGYSFGGPKFSGGSHISFSQPYSGGHSYSPSFGGGSHSAIAQIGGHRGNYPRYTSISGLLKPQVISGGLHYSGVSHTGPQTFGHSSGPPSSFGSQYSSKPSFGYVSPFSSSSGQYGGHSPSLPSYMATKGLGSYASSDISGFSGGHGAPSYSYGAPPSSYAVPSSSYGAPGFGAHAGLNSFSLSGGGLSNFGGSSYSKNNFAGFFDTGKPSFDHGGSSGGSSSHGIPQIEFKPSAFLGSSSSSSPSNAYGAPAISHSASQLGLSEADHAKLLSGTPIYITPKGLGGHDSLSSLISQSHGSPSLTGSYDIPSAGHAAPTASFGQLLGGGHAGVSSSYGVPTYSQGVSSGDYSGASLSHGVSSPISGSQVGGGYSTEEDSEGFGHSSPGNAGSVSGYSTSTLHGSSGQIPSTSYGAPSTSYGVPNTFVSSGKDYSGSSGLSFDGIGSGKLELPSTVGSSSFGVSHSVGGSIPSSSYVASSHGFSSPSGSYVPHETYGPPKGSYSQFGDSQHAQSESKYDTIKYSRSLPVAETDKEKKA